MASLKLTVLVLVIAVFTVSGSAAATPAAGYEAAESCTTQAGYFINCLRLDLKERCCGLAAPKCLCLLKQETRIHCVPNRSCSSAGGGTDAKAVKLAEMNLSCMKNLRCSKRA